MKTKIYKNNVIVSSHGLLKKEKNRVILSSSSNASQFIQSLLYAFQKERILFKDQYKVDRYSRFFSEINPFLGKLDKRNLFSPLRLLIDSNDMTNIFIDGDNVMQNAIKTKNSEAFIALYNSPQAPQLMNGYNESKTVNTIGTCFSLYIDDVYTFTKDSLSFPFFQALVNHPDLILDSKTQIESFLFGFLFTQISDSVFQETYSCVGLACYLESLGSNYSSSIENLSSSGISEAGSIFFIQTILDRFVQNEKEKNAENIKTLIQDALIFCVSKSLPRSLSTILDFPNLGTLPFISDTLDSLLHLAIIIHGTTDSSKGFFNDSYGTFEKLCYFTHPIQNKYGLTVLMLIAMRGWITFAKLVDRIYLESESFPTSKERLDYLNIKDNLGRTALDYAVLYPEMQDYLKSLGCVSNSQIVVSPRNSNLLGGIDAYKKNPDYKKYPFMWLETFYGDIKAVETASLTDQEYAVLPFDINREIVLNFTILGYFGIPIFYELGVSNINAFPQEIAILFGNSEMYSIWNKKLYDANGLLQQNVKVQSLEIGVTSIEGTTTVSKEALSFAYLNTRERNFVTIFSNEKILTQYLDFLYNQVGKNFYLNFLVMNEYILSQGNSKIIKKFQSKDISLSNENTNNKEYRENWKNNIGAPSNFDPKVFLDYLDIVQRFPSSDQTQYCGCCYAVATMSMIDMNLSTTLHSLGLPIYKKGDRLGAQSFQMPLSCMPTGNCLGGGSIRDTLKWHQENYSVPLDCVPYLSWKYMKDQQEGNKPIENGGKLIELCPLSSTKDCVKKATKITSDLSDTYKANTMSGMIQILNQGWAIVGVMRLANDFLTFTGKDGEIYIRKRNGWLADSNVYNSVTNPYIAKSSFHVIVIIGYGEENGLKYWIILNSWGDLYHDFLGQKDKDGNIKMVPYCRVLRGTDDLWIESSGSYYTFPFLRNEDGSLSSFLTENPQISVGQ